MDTTQDRFGDDFGAERMWGLKELPLPDAPDLFPLAPGWYVVMFVALLALVYLTWRAWDRYRQNQYRRDAVTALNDVRNNRARTSEISFILRRTALLAFPRRQVAGLRGQDWVGWLNDTAGRELFAETDGDLLDQLTYSSNTQGLDDAAVDRLLKASSDWARQHHAGV